MTTLDILSHPALRHLAARLPSPREGSADAGRVCDDIVPAGELADILAEVVRLARAPGADAELGRIGDAAARLLPPLRALDAARASSSPGVAN